MQWNWKRVFALTEDGMQYTKYIISLEDRLKEHDPNFFFLNKKFARDVHSQKDYENFRKVSCCFAFSVKLINEIIMH